MEETHAGLSVVAVYQPFDQSCEDQCRKHCALGVFVRQRRPEKKKKTCGQGYDGGGGYITTSHPRFLSRVRPL